jgi:hypothetical protein
MKKPSPYRIPLGVIIATAVATTFSFLFIAKGAMEGRLVMSILMGIIWAISGLIYMTPAMLATWVQSQNHRGIFWLNLLGGWTGILWLAAILWALLDQKIPSDPAKTLANNGGKT